MRIQDPGLADSTLLAPGTTPIAADEPVFLLRASDKCAAFAVRYWATRAELAGAGPDVVKSARAHAAKMEDWPIKRVPDLPKVKTPSRNYGQSDDGCGAVNGGSIGTGA